MRHGIRHWFGAGRALAAGMLRAAGGQGFRYCVVCERRVPAFLPWRGGWAAAPPLMPVLGMVGSDLDHFACPRCGATDRDRHLRMYLERGGLASSLTGKSILHFAPEESLVSWLGTHHPAEHVLADLYPRDSAVRKMDLESIPYADGHFDCVIANHVLEHVNDLDRATHEIGRVLAPTGMAILQTPWCKGLAHSIEDRAVTSAAARLQLYGQDDHVRLFGADVFERIAGDGLRAEPIDHASLLGDVEPDRYGVNPDEVLMLFRTRRN
ncbi:MAG TPA: class I SAM-dependent methyltransferase [Rhodanobacter sp.]|nr:class I SAM-dependent methyltransferase [Rhodanobacter sp.]